MEQIKTYHIQWFKESGYTDDYGNVGYNVKLAEDPDTVLWSTKKDLSDGMEVTGVIETKTSRKGKPYRKFSARKPESAPTQASSGSGGGKPQSDNFTMYMSYAKDLMVAKINNGYDADYDKALQEVIGGAHVLFEGRHDAKSKEDQELEEFKEDLNELFESDKENRG